MYVSGLTADLSSRSLAPSVLRLGGNSERAVQQPKPRPKLFVDPLDEGRAIRREEVVAECKIRTWLWRAAEGPAEHGLGHLGPRIERFYSWRAVEGDDRPVVARWSGHRHDERGRWRLGAGPCILASPAMVACASRGGGGGSSAQGFWWVVNYKRVSGTKFGSPLGVNWGSYTASGRYAGGCGAQ